MFISKSHILKADQFKKSISLKPRQYSKTLFKRPRCFFDINIGNLGKGRVVFEVFY